MHSGRGGEGEGGEGGKEAGEEEEVTGPSSHEGKEGEGRRKKDVINLLVGPSSDEGKEGHAGTDGGDGDGGDGDGACGRIGGGGGGVMVKAGDATIGRRDGVGEEEEEEEEGEVVVEMETSTTLTARLIVARGGEGLGKGREGREGRMFGPSLTLHFHRCLFHEAFDMEPGTTIKSIYIRVLHSLH